MILCCACTSSEQSENKIEDPLNYVSGSFDNFLQIWKEQTDDELHKDKSDLKHEHVHMQWQALDEIENAYDLSFFSGRNNKNALGKKRIRFVKEEGQPMIEIDGHGLVNISYTSLGFKTADGSLQVKGDTLWTTGMGVFPEQKNIKYRLIRCRYFSGWLQYPLPKYEDSTYFLRNLELHDQGGMVELDVEGVDYTAELTQLVYGHRIKLMKLAIYDMPLDSVGINSKSVSYTWTSPEAKRLGINLRKIVAGWTLIEPEYVNSNTMNKEK